MRDNQEPTVQEPTVTPWLDRRDPRGLVHPARCSLIAVCLAARVALAADGDAGRGFVPGEISVGDPIVLPSGPSAGASATAPPPVDAVRSAAPAALAPGNGWIGLAVAESRTPGRWVVAEVVPESPAALAGIRVGDDVRAINGTILQTADDVAQSLTAIAPGQAVSVAVARDEAVTDVRMTAVPRPAPQPPREWQAGTNDAPAAGPSGFVPAGEPAGLPPPVTPPTSVMVPPPATPAASAFAAAPASGVVPPAAPEAFQPVPMPGPARFPPVVPSTPATTPPPATSSAGRGRTALGVRTMPIDPATQSRFRLPARQGAYVIGVVQDLPAARAGLPPGSVIVALDERPVRSPDELTRLVTGGPVGRPVPLEYVLPGGASRRAEVVLQALEQPLEDALVGSPSPTPASVPALQPQPAPTTARKPAATTEASALRNQIQRLEARLDAIEQRLSNR